MSSARVHVIQALADLKAALCTFTAQAKEALSAIDMDIRRFNDWLQDQEKFWRKAVQEAEEAVFLAKQELARRRLMKMGDRPPDTSEQVKALRKAKERLAHAEDKLETTRRWGRQWPQALIDYQGPAGQLTALLEADWPKADAVLEQKIAALEAYVQVSKPPAPKQ